MNLPFQALGTFVFLDLPKDALKHKVMGPNGILINLEVPELQITGKALNVASVGENVNPLIKPGSKVMIFQERASVVTIFGKDYIQIQGFDINIIVNE